MSHTSSLQIEHFFDPATWTLSYLVIDRTTRRCAVIDSVLDYDPKSGRTSTRSADALIARAKELGVSVDWILETHVHADHLSAAQHVKRELGGQIGIGDRVTVVQDVFVKLFNVGDAVAPDGSQFDRLLHDDDVVKIGTLDLRAWHTPGHTPACMSYLVTDGNKTDGSETVVFVGDTLFMPDYGTARCDFPGGDAWTLYRSIQRLLQLPPQTRLYMCHDYLPGGRALQFVCTVAEVKANNVHVHDGIDEDAFVAMRKHRDAELEMPVLILPSVQVNMRGGHLPEPESNGVRYIKIPLDAL